MVRPLNLFAVAAGAACAAIGTRALICASRRIDYRDKVVLISGGSRGLGLVLARQLAEQGAKVAIISRNEDKLKQAAEDIESHHAEVLYQTCDVRDEAQVQLAVDKVVERFGPVDVLINDAGIIQVGPQETMTTSDYREAMDTHFWGPLYLTLAVLPAMRRRKSGRIVNITSIGGKISVPHLLPYCASKFAHVGLSEGLRAELLKENIFVTTVCPGMMRTGSHVNAFFKGKNEQEFAWFSIGNGLPFTSVSAEKAAHQIIEAARFGRAELIISLQAQAAIKFASVFPGITTDMFGVVNAMLPGPNGHGTQRFRGSESQSWLSPSLLTKMSDDQIERNNEQAL